MVQAVMIIEMMGRPPEHISGQLKEHIEQIEKIKGAKILKKEFSEPKEVDVKNKLYTCFVEVEIECEDLIQLTQVIFDFMPSSIEILEPTRVSFSLDEATSFLNNLSGRLHRYDDVVKVMKNREEKFSQEIQLALRVLKAYDLVNDEGKIKDEALEKVKEGNKKN